MQARSLRALLVLSSFALVITASSCALPGDDEAAEITSAIDDHIVSEIEALSGDLTQVRTYLCRRGDASDGIYSLRSFDGRLCDSTYVDGLDVVGGAALLICWEGNHEDFQDSGCAENALEEYGLETYDQSAVVEEMAVRIDAYASDAGGVTYDVAKALLCVIPATLLGPAAPLRDVWCGT